MKARSRPPSPRFGDVRLWVLFAVAIDAARVASVADESDRRPLPAPAAVQADFDRDIRPIFEASCLRCHQLPRPKSGYRLDNRDRALGAGNNNRRNVVPGESEASPLIHYVARLEEDMEMPPVGQGDPLTPEQIGLLRAWVDQGAKWSEDGARARRQSYFSATPTVQWISVNGNQRQFREHWWQREGWSGGVQRFELRQGVGREAELTVDGRALYDQGDYGLSLNLGQPELGFVRSGFDILRSFYNDVGGYYQPFRQPPPTLDQDLWLDVGKAWLDVGLTRPNLPLVTVGYEYQFRDGDKSTLQWGLVAPAPDSFSWKAIYPNRKNIDEDVHIAKLSLSYEIGGVRLEDDFRAELYKLRTQRTNQGDFDPDTTVAYREGYDHDRLANAFRVEKQVRDWLFLSGGYLYARLDGEGSFEQSFQSTSGAFPPFSGEQANPIALDQQSHTFNVNSRLGPWQGLTFSAAWQNDWVRRRGLTDWVAPGFEGDTPGRRRTSLDRSTMDESFGLRFTTLPFTVIYADTRLQQEWSGLAEGGFVDDDFGDSRDFARDTDATGDLHDTVAGFTISPWPRVSLDAHYRHRNRYSRYDHLVDTDGSEPPAGIPGNGYPAFISSRATTLDEVQAKLVRRWNRWLRTTFKLQLGRTRYDTTTEASMVPGFPENIFLPGGHILAGDEHAQRYSLNLTLTPWRRLYLTASGTYSDSSIVSAVNDGRIVAPYEGDLISLLSNATYVLDEQTDLRFTYSFSRADYAQHNYEGLPLGIEYHRNGLMAGITRRLQENLRTSLSYGFFEYREPTAGGANDYVAHGLFATVSARLP